jgi:hypothetical protein
MSPWYMVEETDRHKVWRCAGCRRMAVTGVHSAPQANDCGWCHPRDLPPITRKRSGRFL